MGVKFKDRVRETISGAPGLADFTLAGADVGAQTFLGGGFVDGTTLIPYVAESADKTVWEYGRASLSAGVIVRDPIKSSAGVATKASFPTGSRVANTWLAEDIPDLTQINTFIPAQIFSAMIDLGAAANGSPIVPTTFWSGSYWPTNIRIVNNHTAPYESSAGVQGYGYRYGFIDLSDINVSTGTGGGAYIAAYINPYVKVTDTKTTDCWGLFGGPNNDSPTLSTMYGLLFGPTNYANMGAHALLMVGQSTGVTNFGSGSAITLSGNDLSIRSTVAGVTSPLAYVLDCRFRFSGAGSTFTEGFVARLRSNNAAADFLKCTDDAGTTRYFRVDGLGTLILAENAFLYGDAANVLALRNGVNPQSLYVYNTWTSGTVYERGMARWSSNVYEIGTEAAGGGTLRNTRLTGAKLHLNAPFTYGNSFVQLGSDADGAILVTSTGASSLYDGITAPGLIRINHLISSITSNVSEHSNYQDFSVVNNVTDPANSRIFYALNLQPIIRSTDTATNNAVAFFGQLYSDSPNIKFLRGFQYTGRSNGATSGAVITGGDIIGRNAGVCTTATLTGLRAEARNSSANVGASFTKMSAVEAKLDAIAGPTYSDFSVFRSLSNNQNADIFKATDVAGTSVYFRILGQGAVAALGTSLITVGSAATGTYLVNTGQWSGSTWGTHVRLTHNLTAYSGGEHDGFADESSVDVQAGGTGNYYSASFEPLIKATDTNTRLIIGVYGAPKNLSPTATGLWGLNFTPLNSAACASMQLTGVSCVATNTGVVTSLTIKGGFFECNNSGAGITAPEAWAGDFRFAFSGAGSTYTKGGVARFRTDVAGADFLHCTDNAGTTFRFRIKDDGSILIQENARLYGDAANVLALRNATNAQSLLVYNTWTSGTVYERGFMTWASNVFEVGTEAAGGGTLRNLKLTAAKINLNASCYGTSFIVLGEGTDGTQTLPAGFNRAGELIKAHYLAAGLRTDNYDTGNGYSRAFADLSSINVTSSTASGSYMGAEIAPTVLATDTKTNILYGIFGGPENYSTTLTELYGLYYLPYHRAGSTSAVTFYGLNAFPQVAGSGTINGGFIKGVSTGFGFTSSVVQTVAAYGVDVYCNLHANTTVSAGAGIRVLSNRTTYDFLRFATHGNTAWLRVDGVGAIIATNGTLTTSDPAFSATQTWNAGAVAFTALKVNITDTASAAASLLIDLQVGASSKFSVDKNGGISCNALAVKKQAISASGTLTIDYNLGRHVELTLTGDITTFSAISNWPASGYEATIIVDVLNTGAFGITDWPAGAVAVGGAAPTITSGSGKKSSFMLRTYDGGTTIYVDAIGADYTAI